MCTHTTQMYNWHSLTLFWWSNFSWVTFHTCIKYFWSAKFCKLPSLPSIHHVSSTFDLPNSASCPVYLPYMYQVLLICQILQVAQFTFHTCIKYFWSAKFCKLPSLKKGHRRRESSFGIGLKWMCISSVIVNLEWCSYEPKMQRRVHLITEIFPLSSEMSWYL